LPEAEKSMLEKERTGTPVLLKPERSKGYITRKCGTLRTTERATEGNVRENKKDKK
jgi:hypothetical protein